MISGTPLQSWATILLLIIFSISVAIVLTRLNAKLDQMAAQRRRNREIQERNRQLREAKRG